MNAINFIANSNTPIDLTEITILGLCFASAIESKDKESVKNIADAKAFAEKIIESCVYNDSYIELTNSPNLSPEEKRHMAYFKAYTKELCRQIKSYAHTVLKETEKNIDVMKKQSPHINFFADASFWASLFTAITIEALDEVDVVYDDEANEVVLRLTKSEDAWEYTYKNIPETLKEFSEYTSCNFNGFTSKEDECDDLLNFMGIISSHLLLHTYRIKQHESGDIDENLFEQMFGDADDTSVCTSSDVVQ